MFSFHRYFENLIGLTCQNLRICMTLLYVRTNLFPPPPTEFLGQDVNRQVSNWEMFSNEKHKFFLPSAETPLAENSRTCTCMWLFLRLQLTCLQNHRLDILQQGLSGQFHLCVRSLDKYTPKNFLCVCTLLGLNWQKFACALLFFSIV